MSEWVSVRHASELQEKLRHAVGVAEATEADTTEVEFGRTHVALRFEWEVEPHEQG